MQVGEDVQSWEDAKRVVEKKKHASPRGEKRIAQAMVLFRLAVVHNNNKNTNYLLHVEKNRVEE